MHDAMQTHCSVDHTCGRQCGQCGAVCGTLPCYCIDHCDLKLVIMSIWPLCKADHQLAHLQGRCKVVVVSEDARLLLLAACCNIRDRQERVACRWTEGHNEETGGWTGGQSDMTRSRRATPTDSSHGWMWMWIGCHTCARLGKGVT